MRRFQNYHKHTYYSNPYTPDCTVSPKEYAIRAKEVGAELLSSVEHGWCGNVWEYYKTAKENELKLLIGAEAYAVKDRHEADRTNAHICLLAKNENGRQALNDILSEANLTGFYAKPRVDMELLLSLPANDVWVTTACVAGLWKYEDSDELVKKLFEHFREHLFLEVQAHNTESQIALNQHILELSKSLGAKIIAGVDSHYISKDQDKVRTDFLNSKNIFYEEEQGWELDYPDGDELYSRFAKQCVLSHEQIVEAMENTNTFLDVEEYDSPIFETETIKLPSIYPDWTQEQKDAEYQRLVWQGWDNYKNEVPESEWPHYEEEIKKEIQVVLDTGFSDYFLLDYHVVKRGKEKGGILTHAGRGSAVSWITVMLLGMTEVDRIAAKVHMYPQRFATAERILQTKSLFDIDLNQVDSKPFQEAQKEILGEECAYPMLAYGTSQKSAAWKLYAKSQGIPFEVANEVSEQLRRYDMAVKHADEDSKDDIDIYDYIEPKFREIWEGAQDYVGIVTSWSIHPCANLVYSGNIRKEIGLVKIKDNICCCMDGHWAEECHFLKNDFLIVKVLSLIDKAYKEAGIPVPTVNELLRMSPPDDACWDVYAKGATVGINQVEQPGTSARVQVYKPTNISELTAFVAAIRPGFKSMYKKFESREDFSYGIPSFDKLIQTKEFPYSYMLYQEQAMAALNHAGIPMKDCYAAIKNIAKKRVDKVLALKETFISGFEKALIKDGTDQKFAATKAEMVWQIIEDSSRYSFNCSHAYCVALDSLYGAWIKAHYPLAFYKAYLIVQNDKGDKDKMNAAKAEAEDYFGIHFPPFKFGQDNREITANPKTNEITNCLSAIKGFSKAFARNCYECGKQNYKSFIDVLRWFDSRSIKTARLEPLIKIDYFSQYGTIPALMNICDMWNMLQQGNALTVSKKKLDTATFELFKPYVISENTKGKELTLLKITDINSMLYSYEKIVVEKCKTDLPYRVKIQNQLDILGYVDLTTGVAEDRRKLFVTDCTEQKNQRSGEIWAYRIGTKSVGTGKTARLTVRNSVYKKDPIHAGDILYAANLFKNDAGYWYLTDYKHLS